MTHTDEQLNEAIAKAKGINLMSKRYEGWTPEESWIFTDYFDQERIPQYTSDWRLAGELLEEMTEKGYCPCLIYDDNGHWAVSTDGTQTLNFESPCDVSTSFFVKKDKWCDTPKRAICETYVEIEGIEI